MPSGGPSKWFWYAAIVAVVVVVYLLVSQSNTPPPHTMREDRPAIHDSLCPACPACPDVNVVCPSCSDCQQSGDFDEKNIALYLSLLKKSLLDAIYGTEDDGWNGKNSLKGGYPARAHTMLPPRTLDHVNFVVADVIKRRIPGDVIETGVWRGGSTILMKGVLTAYGDTTRNVWVADSFKGIPRPNADKYPADKGDPHYLIEALTVSSDQVRSNFRAYDLLDDRVKFLEGYFSDTIPTAPIEKLAVLRLDGDIYESTIEVLNHLYPKTSIGGWVIIDDYHIRSCAQAVNDYRTYYGITEQMIDLLGSRPVFEGDTGSTHNQDKHLRYWKKERQPDYDRLGKTYSPVKS